MSDEKLKLVETCALLILLREGQEISNTDLKKLRGLELKKADREHLENLKLIDVRTENRRLHLALSDIGWKHALDLIGTEPPARSGYQGAAIHAQVAALRDFLEASQTPLSEFYAPHSPVGAEPPTRDEEQESPPTIDTVAALIRKAYDELAPTPGDAIKIARIRTALAHVRHADIDAALTAMNRQDGVQIFAEANQKTLTDADRAAAVSIGNQDKHLLVIK
jgi:hypothetical protein